MDQNRTRPPRRSAQPHREMLSRWNKLEKRERADIALSRQGFAPTDASKVRRMENNPGNSVGHVPQQIRLRCGNPSRTRRFRRARREAFLVSLSRVPELLS